MKKIKVGIIGQGRSGRNIHGEYLVTDDRFQIVAVSDLISGRRDWAVKNYGCEAYADYKEMLSRTDLDLVVNATFSYLHVPVTLDILAAGHNVLCEKPLANSVADVDKLIAAAKDAGKLFAIYQQSRFAPYFTTVEKVIASGVLGRIVQISAQFNGFSRRWDWQTLQEFHGGNLLNTGPHPLDQVLQLFGEGMPKVTCFMDRTEDGSFGNAENHVKVILSGEGHPVIDMEISSCCAYPSFTYKIYGSKGGYMGTTNTSEWKYFKPEEAPEQKLIKTPLEDADGNPIYGSEQLKWYSEKWSLEDETKARAAYSSAAAPTQGGMTGSYYNMLYKTLTEGAPLLVTPEQVRRQIAVIEECQRQNPHIYARKNG